MGAVLYLCVIRAQTDTVSTTGFSGRHDRNLRPNDEYPSDLVRNERTADTIANFSYCRLRNCAYGVSRLKLARNIVIFLSHNAYMGSNLG